MSEPYPNRQSYYSLCASRRKKSYTISSPPCNGPGDVEHILHNSENSRHHFGLLRWNNKSNSIASLWADHKWNMEWQKNTSLLHTFIPFAGSSPPGMTLLRYSWVRLNCLSAGVGLLRSTMHKWGSVPSSDCRSEAEEQTADHILAS